MSPSPLASTPPMGWNSWNNFGPKVSEEAVRQTADAFVTLGLKDCGYEYLVIDDCWSVKEGRDANGDLVADPVRFPNGMRALADYVHSKGLKIGIYSDAAERTCGSYPGSFGFEEQDAALWAGWGIDFLKYDYCHAPADQATAIERYRRMGEVLKNCGRQILFSLCEWGGRSPWLWGRQVGGQMWRVTGDVVDSWTDIRIEESNWTPLGIDSAIETAINLHPYAGPGGWNDLDMLVVGLKGRGNIPGLGLAFHEYQTPISMWSILCSPLMIGCDVPRMDNETAALLMNREVLAVNQDPLGRQARRLKQHGGLELWHKPLADGSMALALLNRGSSAGEISFSAGEIGMLDTPKQVRDLWKQDDIADFFTHVSLDVLAHCTKLLRISP
jgi:alpha-galactosidase